MNNEQDVIAFLAQTLALPEEKVTIWSRLRQDLHVDGDVAADLIADFAYAFHVDLENFRFNDFFNTGGNAPAWMAWWLSWFGNAKTLKTLTVRDLIRAADKGYLV